MIDDLKYIHDKDPSDALGVAEKQYQQLNYHFDFNAQKAEINNVVVCGMGGSALPAVYFNSWPELQIPLQIIRGYEVPGYVNNKTLAIISSYSGNTEETLSALTQAEQRGAQIVVVSAGGKLKEIAETKKYPLLNIPTGIQPRMSTFYFINAFSLIFEKFEVIKPGSNEELKKTSSWLEQEVKAFLPTLPTANNPTKQLAKDLIGKSVVVYSGPKLFPSANKLKIGLNENAKNVAFVYQYPEFNHNEFIGWTGQPIDKPYAVVEIRSNLEHERVQKRFIVSEKLLSGKRPYPNVIIPKGETLLQQLLWSSIFVDFTSIYTALLNGIDPTPVDLVEQFKVELNRE